MPSNTSHGGKDSLGSTQIAYTQAERQMHTMVSPGVSPIQMEINSSLLGYALGPPSHKKKNKLGEGCVLAWALPYCGILTRLGSHLDLGMPKLTLVHWSRQNLSATHNPIFVFKRE